MKLLSQGDPPPFELFNGQGRAPVMLFCDHASRFIPASLGQLGLSGDDLAWAFVREFGEAHRITGNTFCGMFGESR